ncbi:hypothetical protein JCM10449v2_005053 [Rhodotorula kratochvilovae]
MAHYGGGASHLAAIYGSEQDKVNCSFYLKIGACRHGERCSRKHIKPQYSQTLVLLNAYQNPAHIQGTTSNPHLRPKDAPPLDPNPQSKLNEEETKEYFDKFYEDVYCELVKYGNLLEMHVCDNVGDHLIGNVYARFEWEDQAQRAVDDLNKRWYAGRPLYAELSPVTDFREACCRQNDMGTCDRGGFCNFHHLRYPSKSLLKELQREQRVERRLNPDPQDEERKKELEMFGKEFMGAPGGGGGGSGGGGPGGPPGGGGGYGGRY